MPGLRDALNHRPRAPRGAPLRRAVRRAARTQEEQGSRHVPGSTRQRRGPTPRAIAQRRTEGRAHDPAVARQAAVTTARTRRTGARNTPPSGKGTRRSRYEHGSPTNPPPVKTPPAGDETSTHEPDGTQHAERAAATSEHAREPERYATGGALSRKRNRFDDAYAPLTVHAGTSPRHAVSLPYGHGGAPVDDARPCVATRARALARPSRSPHATGRPGP